MTYLDEVLGERWCVYSQGAGYDDSDGFYHYGQANPMLRASFKTQEEANKYRDELAGNADFMYPSRGYRHQVS